MSERSPASSGPTSINGFGGLHGGVAFSLVGDAAAGAAAHDFGAAKTTSALVRYLAPGAGIEPNPNGSSRDIAGICNPAGTIVGLMPHPENAIDPPPMLASPRPRWR